MNEIVESPFASRAGQVAEGAGSRQLQARENTEVMAMAMMAKRFPRDQVAACDRIRNAFTRVTLAEKAQFQFARGGSDIVGPSIRAAEAMAQQWGNMANGWREVSRSVGPDGVGVSEVETFSVDYESTNRESIQFVVRHWRDTKKGGYALKDERDIYELCANQAQRRKRACILAQIPGDVVEMAMDQASVTLKTSADTTPEAMRKMVDAFGAFGVTREQIEKRIQRRLDSIQPAQVVALKRIFVSLRDEMSTAADWFDVDPEQAASGLDAVKAAAAAARGRTPAPRPARKGADVPAPAAPPPAPIDTHDGAMYLDFQAYADSVLLARDADAAAAAVDTARGTLVPDEYEKLCAIYRERWVQQP
jgi:hypothetical protein